MAEAHPALDRFVDKAGQLYSLPMVAVDVLQLTSQPKVDLAVLKECLLRDPALVGKILRTVNSSLFGLSREVSDLSQALALLGTKSVRLLVLGFSLPDELFLDLAGEMLRRYWHHAMIKAAAAREISESVYRLPGEEPFIAGLLQDIGQLVLIQQLGQPYVRFLDRAFAKEVDVCAAEAVTLGFDHVQLSARLLARWGLPEGLVTAIGVGRSSERLAQAPPANRPLAQILHLADLLAGMLTEGRGDWLSELLHVGQRYHQLHGAQLNALVDTLQVKVRQLADVLSWELPAELNYRGVYEEAHRQLTAAADEAAVDLAVARRSIAAGMGDDEVALLDEAAALSEAVRRFAQPAQLKSAKHPAAAVHVGTVQSTLDRSAAGGTVAAATAVDPADWVPPVESKSLTNSPLTRQVATAVAACRQARCPLSLILVVVDRYDDLLAQLGPYEAQRLVQLVGLICGRVEHPQASHWPISASKFALLLPNCDRPAAGEIGHHLLRDVRKLSDRHADVAQAKLSVSVGAATVAIPPKNFLPEQLVESADRCLHAAQLSSGNALKSIDVL